MFEQSNKLRFGVALFFTLRFFICHVSDTGLKRERMGEFWTGGEPAPTRQDYHIQ